MISHMKSRMRESCKSGSVRDASCKRCVYSTPYTKGIKEALIDLLEKSGMKYQVNGTSDKSISSTLNICIDGVASEAPPPCPDPDFHGFCKQKDIRPYSILWPLFHLPEA